MNFDGFLSPGALADWGVALMVVVVFVNTFLRLAPEGWAPYGKLVALVAALAVVFAAGGLPYSPAGWLTAVANGLGLFLASLGSGNLAADVAHGREEEPARQRSLGPIKRPFLTRW